MPIVWVGHYTLSSSKGHYHVPTAAVPFRLWGRGIEGEVAVLEKCSSRLELVLGVTPASSRSVPLRVPPCPQTVRLAVVTPRVVAAGILPASINGFQPLPVSLLKNDKKLFFCALDIVRCAGEEASDAHSAKTGRRNGLPRNGFPAWPPAEYLQCVRSEIKPNGSANGEKLYSEWLKKRWQFTAFKTFRATCGERKQP